ncbi:SusC/RagA family TonB-linked outer membrane protein, partial [Parabacteroides sp. OttesenSCG-928-K15]|nr:SusC/RagA family TonB-linked outer membrane protein [Parabacteroides sp. OttesenSCG-928-K15]
FDFQMFWQGVAKRDYMLGGAQFWGFTSQWDTPYTPALDYWTTENRNAYFPRPSWQNGGNRQNSDRYLQNAAYIRLKNVTIGYTLPATFLKKNGIDKLRVYVTGENLLTLTPLNDAFDPETLGNLTYPINRKISIGLNVSF